jgi:Tol biopolymer transport system component
MDVAESMLETAARKGWVMASGWSSRPRAIPAPADEIVVTIGKSRNVIFRSGVGDIELSRPIVSRDGTRLAFVKVDNLAGKPMRRLWVVNSDGSGLRAVLDLFGVGIPIPGALIGGPNAAWAPDGRMLAVNEPLPNDRSANVIKLLDVDAATIRSVLSAPQWATSLMPQAWSADGRHLLTSRGDLKRIALVDVATGEARDLGEGSAPVWSPDGGLIAAVLGVYQRESYILLTPQSGFRREALTFTTQSRLSLFRAHVRLGGPVLWSPDSRYLLFPRGDETTAWVLDIETREAAPLPRDVNIESWGGRP